MATSQQQQGIKKPKFDDISIYPKGYITGMCYTT